MQGNDPRKWRDPPDLVRAQMKEGERDLRGRPAEDQDERDANWKAYGRRHVLRSCVACDWTGPEWGSDRCPMCNNRTTEERGNV